MVPPIVIVSSQGIQICMTAQFLHPASIPIRRIQSRRNRAVTDAVGTHDFVDTCGGARLSDEIIDRIPT